MSTNIGVTPENFRVRFALVSRPPSRFLYINSYVMQNKYSIVYTCMRRSLNNTRTCQRRETISLIRFYKGKITARNVLYTYRYVGSMYVNMCTYKGRQRTDCIIIVIRIAGLHNTTLYARMCTILLLLLCERVKI
jgi:hypothetical protein